MFSIEELVASAKKTGSAVGIGVACFWYDFGKDANAGAVGSKRTKLVIPANTLVESGFVHVRYGPANAITGATVGTYSLQVISAGDLVGSVGNPAVGLIQNCNRISSGVSDREVVINIASAAAPAQLFGFFRLVSLGA